MTNVKFLSLTVHQSCQKTDRTKDIKLGFLTSLFPALVALTPYGMEMMQPGLPGSGVTGRFPTMPDHPIRGCEKDAEKTGTITEGVDRVRGRWEREGDVRVREEGEEGEGGGRRGGRRRERGEKGEGGKRGKFARAAPRREDGVEGREGEKPTPVHPSLRAISGTEIFVTRSDLRLSRASV